MMKYSSAMLAVLWFSAGAWTLATATEYHASPGDIIQNYLDLLQPGDTLWLAPGTYTEHFRIKDKNSYSGSPYNTYPREYDDPGMWITIRGEDSGSLPVLRYNGISQNVVDLWNQSCYIKLIDLEITEGSDGVKLDGTGIHHVVIENCYIHDTGSVAVGMQGGASFITVRNSEIARSGTSPCTGELMYLGKHDGTAPFTDSLIEYCYIHDSKSTNASEGDGIEIKRGGARNIIRYNVIHSTKYPGIFSYGTDSTDPADGNRIYGNAIWDSNDAGIQVTGNSDIFNNVIFDCDRCLSSNEYSGSPEYFQHVRIYNNTFYRSKAGNVAVYLANQFRAVASNSFYNNAVYDVTPPTIYTDAADIRDNVVGNLSDAAADMVNPSTVPGSCDFYPTAAGALIDAGGSGAPIFDFNGNARDANPDIGAYEYTQSGTPGWQIGASFRGEVTEPPSGKNGSGSGGCILTGSSRKRTIPFDVYPAMFLILWLPSFFSRKRKHGRSVHPIRTPLHDPR